MTREIKLVLNNNYETIIDEVRSIVINNSLGQSFEYHIEEIKDIDLLTPTKE